MNKLVLFKMKNKKVLWIFTVILFLLLPVFYLIYKTSDVPDVPQEQTIVNQPPSVDINTLENAVKTNPTFDNLINLSISYINNKMPGKSIEYLKNAIEINPKSAIAYNNLGVAYTMLQQYQNGVDACAKALQLDSTFQLAKNNFKWASDEKNKVLTAITLEEQTPENKKNTAFYIEYGLNYFKLSNYDKSIEIWNKVFDIEPKNTSALNNIGTAFMMKYQYDDAIVFFKKVIGLESNNSLAKNNLMWAMDEKNKAEALLKK
jgi:tetratricopeptide (TPR) repeat protein